MIAKKISGIIFIMIFSVSAFSQNKDAILGKWLNASGQGQIIIYKTGEKYSGKLVWLKEPDGEDGKPKRDVKNPKPELKNRPLLGIQILQNFTYSGDGVWEDGSIYDPKTGKVYSCKISMVSSDELYIRGYVGISLLGRTEIWKRAQS